MYLSVMKQTSTLLRKEARLEAQHAEALRKLQGSTTAFQVRLYNRRAVDLMMELIEVRALIRSL